MKIYYIAHLSILAFLYSCSFSKIEVDYHIPSSSGMTPETSGERFSGHGEIGAQADQKVIIGSSVSTSFLGIKSSYVQTTPSFDSSYGVGVNGAIGVADFIDIYAKTSSESVILGGLKIQPLGSGFIKKEKGFKLSFAGGIGAGSQEESDFTITASSNRTTAKADTKLLAFEGIVSSGYRFTKNFLVYLTGYHTKYKVESDLTAQDGTLYLLKNTTEVSSISSGILLSGDDDFRSKLKLEVGYSQAKARDARDHDHLSALLRFGIYW